MKSILISISPKWCELIASGQKTVEVRKTRPKIETPFKVYIYCTHNNRKNGLHTYINSGYGRKNFGVIGNWRSGKEIVDVNSHLPAYRYNAYLAEGKVIGEFVCDCITPLYNVCYDEWKRLLGGLHRIEKELVGLACLTEKELHSYANGKRCNAWHISDLVIYDQPKELIEFRKICQSDYCHTCDYAVKNNGYLVDCDRSVKRPPQSWCYVEEVQHG